ncbi:18078_t:CDS:2 [Rhizophagus irregularis]|nr:18078_t:CDS:2 [Rhizophagus irregularis]
MVKRNQPKVYDPYVYHKPHSIRWKGSVLPRVLPSTLVVTIVAVIVTVLYEKTDVKLGIDSTFIPILGFVVGLLLTYRTNTAYDRYWEGRRFWSVLVVAIRNLTRTIWINVKEDEGTKDILEKKTAINLLLGFAVATKHYLREEEGSNHEDLKYLISNIKSSLPGFAPIEDQDLTENKIRENLKLGRQSSLKMFKPKVKPHQRRKGTPIPVSHNLPLEITLYLSSYIDTLAQKKKTDVPTTNSMYAALNTMVDCLTQFERILRSPIPLAYSIHLKQTVWIYCLSLPFQLIKNLHYITIPVVFLASMILMGIELLIKRELDKITSNPRPTVESWVYNQNNYPFGDDVTGTEARKLSIDDVRSKLSSSSSNNDGNKSSLDISVQQ